MDSKRDRIISLLGQGYSQATVASALGVTASYVSQLAEEDEVREQVSQLRVGKLQERVDDDSKLETLERKSLQMVADKMPFVKSPMEAVKIFQTLNNAKRKTASSVQEQDANNVESVTITLPRSAAAIHIQMNTTNQVVEIEGRSMAPLPSRALHMLRPPVDVATDVVVNALPQSKESKQAETTKRLLADDAATATQRLDSMEVLIDGVLCVL